MAFWNKGFKRISTPQCRLCGYDKILAPLGLVGFKQDTIVGNGEKKILLVVEPRTMNEVRIGPALAKGDKADELRFRVMPHFDIFEDCWIIPATQCSPVSKTPKGVVDDDKPKRMGMCRAWIEKNIEELQPKIVIFMGDMAIRTWFTETQLENVSEYHMAGFAIPDYKYNTWMLPVLGFNEYYSKPKEEGWNNVFNKEFRKALSYVDMPLPPKPDYDSQVRVLTEYEDVVRTLQSVIDNKPEWFDYDYETNALKPQQKGAKIVSVSWATDDEIAYSCPIRGWGHFSEKQYLEIERLLSIILADNDIKKSAHNMHMENSWTRVALNTFIGNWGWDSMVGQHMLDPRTGVKALKFLAYCCYGFGPYNLNIKPWLEGINETTGLNRIEEGPKMDILHYGGLDSLFGRKLRQDQMQKMRYGTPRLTLIGQAFHDVYMPGVITMSEMSINGFRVDIEGYDALVPKLREEQAQIVKELLATPECKAFFDKYRVEFSVSSGADMRKLLFEVMGLESSKQTKGGDSAVSVDVLEELDIPICKMVCRWRKIEKVIGTFITGYKDLTTADNLIHPSYNLHTTRTGRSSSTDPNWQNIPKRDKEQKKIIRSGIYPPYPEHHLAETDYGSLEIRVFTCHSQDPVLIDYLVNGGDMHRDEAVHVFALPSKDHVHKEVRQCMKMGWNFALLYGSYYRACAIKMWEEIVMKGLCLADKSAPDGRGMTIRQWLANKGVMSENDFIWWCKDREKEFWDKFHVTYEYRQRVMSDYIENGYVRTKFGFTRPGILTPNQIINTPTQGTGSGMLTWSANMLLDIARKEKWRTVQNGQVHDSLITSPHPDEIQHVFNTQEYVMTKLIRQRFDWIIVPLEVEIEMTPEPNMPWTDLQGMHKDENGLWVFN